MDYSKYRFTFKEKLKMLAMSLGISLVVAYLFYDQLWCALCFPVVLVVVIKRSRRKKIEEQKDKLTEEFMDFLKNVSAALLAGYSMENAWREAQKELALMHGTSGYMYREISEMNRSISMNEPLEQVLEKFAKRTQIDEIESFSEIFSFAKRSGGDFVRIIETTTSRLSQKFETFREIEVSLAAKRLEQKIMNGIPLFILAYLKLGSADYMEALYRNLVGVSFMTGCLLAYGGALLLSEKIVNISM